jgi:hypothetical protein
MQSKPKFVIISVIACVGLFMWGTASRGVAQRDSVNAAACSAAHVAGTYSYAAFGTVFAGNPAGFPPGAYNTAATLVMDRTGNFVVDGKTSYNGTIMDDHFEGTFAVGVDCSVTYFVQGLPSVYAVFANNGKEARGVSLIPGTSVTFLTVAK